MRYSNYHIPTLKEAPKEAELVSHQLLIRGGYIRKLAAGIYTFMPLGLRSLNKIMKIIREEMELQGAVEVLLPSVQPAELWQESGRWRKYGPELLRFKDRKGGDFCIGPTHEEVIVDLVRRDLRSYREMPLNLYQIQTKFRDEIRPRGGLIRAREFIMKDAYSFDRDEEAAQVSYRKMYNAYNRIFIRCGLEYRCVEADTGNIGGSMSHEFQVLVETGEDAVVSCTKCGYTANLEKGEISEETYKTNAAEERMEIERVHTPGRKSVEEVCAFLKTAPERLVKTLIYIADGEPIAFLIRGDRDLNETKAKSLLGCHELVMADAETVERLTGSPIGFAGPVGLPVRKIADNSVKFLTNFITGANEKDWHFINVNHGSDFEVERFTDIAYAKNGDRCGRCGGEYYFYRGIEVGHIFFLGTKYSAPMRCHFLDETGVEKPIVMGCYGIGVTRLLSAAIEQNHDEKGIRLPLAIAPFETVVVPLNTDDDAVMSTANGIYDELKGHGFETLIDDRDERAGVKLNDADLIGIPYQIIVGKKSLEKGGIEVKRRGQKGDVIPREALADFLRTDFERHDKAIEELLRSYE